MRVKLLLGLLVFGLIFTIYIIYENNDLTVNYIDYINEKIPEKFEGYKIVQISDLHNKSFGKDQSKLLRDVKKVNPNVIFITGDLVDRKTTDFTDILNFVKELRDDYSIYFVTGNHEADNNKYYELKVGLLDLGVIILENNNDKIYIDGAYINVIGVNDPRFYGVDSNGNQDNSLLLKAFDTYQDEDVFTVLLSHRPELFKFYPDYDIDLVFSGHAHGGQIRLPFIGPIIAPGQRLFPKYTTGTYTENSTTMVVSRGLGTSVLPVRILNKPEIVVVTLKKG